MHTDWFRVGEAGATHGAGRTGTRNVRNGVLFSWIHAVKTRAVSQGCEKVVLHGSKKWHGLGKGNTEIVGWCGVKTRAKTRDR